MNSRISVASPLFRIVLAAACCVVVSQSAWAGASQEVVDHYTKTCEEMAKMGTPEHPIADSDIRDAPKFHAFCGCFGKKFGDRAVTYTAPMQSKEEIKAALDEELEMRQSCRRDFGLPPVPPKKPRG